ncbi:MAG: type I DNA topoisomerase [SAR324 cluster bacterium]|nr:type I DNA topoisomerase [SAR324 cluster bacterium]
MPKSLVIVESPTKARTLARFLGSDFVVESSIGHIRDLPESAKEIPADLKKEPWARLGIDVENGFKPLYVISADKKKQIAKLKQALKGVDTLYLATDEDREGESISWHLREVLKPKVPTRRLVFHEITKEAIERALNTTRDIDDRLVTAQETRRVLDRLYGYEISPLLWRKIAPQLSAGRVQSVAVFIVVRRERERMAFRAASYWDLQGAFAGSSGESFAAQLISIDGKRLVSGKDFDDRTGLLRQSDRKLIHLDENAAVSLREDLAQADWRVIKVERKPYTSQPQPPFTTSTLQQEAGRKLGFTARQTMGVAQALYEQGFITYMRTDSTTLSDEALRSARSQIRSLYGDQSLPAEPRVYRTKVKNAQEAHEAIRPSGDIFRLPESLRGELESRQFRLYELIWKRTVASQMEDARGQRVTLQVQGGDAVFQATGRTIEFPGYLRAYVEGSDDPQAELSDQEKVLPSLSEGEHLNCNSLDTTEHHTQPPARFTEASLIRELEKEGVGRPSTYASIIDTILRREYVSKKGSALVPSFTAFAVSRLLEQYFGDLVDIRFTARMEDVLDAISNGERESLPYLKSIYFGDDQIEGLSTLIKVEIDPREVCTIPLAIDSQQRQMNVRVGKYGPYLERNGDRASLPADQVPDELTAEVAEALLDKGNEPTVLGTDEETGKTIYVKTGRYGPYVQLGDNDENDDTDEKPKMKSLLPGQTPDSITLEDAKNLLSLPRTVGIDADTDEVIVVDLGRYGPYAKRGNDSRTLANAEALFEITLDEVKALFLQPKSVRRGQSAVVREMGPHPESEAPIRLMAGRYGPYVTDGEINASLPRNADPDALDLAGAVQLLAERAARGPATRKSGRRAASVKSSKPKVSAAKPASRIKKARTGAAAKSASKSANRPAKKPVLRKRRQA